MPATQTPRLLITGATGQLGALVIERLLRTVPPAAIAALVRDASTPASERLAARGVAVRSADYRRPDTLDEAFRGVERLLFVSSSAFEGRVAEHRNVVEAAAHAGVRLLAYTSVLRADTSRLGVAVDHRDTEALIRASGVPFVLLRNGWYHENYMASVPAALAQGGMIGSAGAGRIASAARADYADAAAAVLTAPEEGSGRVYELAGDASYTLSELAAEVSRQSGRSIAYTDLPEADFEAALLGAGLPAPLARLLADSDAAAAEGALFDDGHALSRLIGRATTPLSVSVAEALTRR